MRRSTTLVNSTARLRAWWVVALAVAVAGFWQVPAAADGQSFSLAGETGRVSVSSSGEQQSGTGAWRDAAGNTWPHDVAVSDDGTVVAFTSGSANLVPGDTNRAVDVFVRDLLAGVTERVSVSSLGAQGDGGSFQPVMSADGRHIGFTSLATNLVPADGNGGADVFIHDRLTGRTDRVSVDPQGRDATGFCYLDCVTATAPSISRDGRYVVFQSGSAEIVPGDTNHSYDIFVRDLLAGVTERVSVSSLGVQGDRASTINGGRVSSPSISDDGRFVVFPSGATNLVPGDTNADVDVFVRDRVLGTTERVSLTGDGAQGDIPDATRDDVAGSQSPAVISADGRVVAFWSRMVLLPGVGGHSARLYVRDLASGTLELAGAQSDGRVDAPGQTSTWGTWQLGLSPDGRFVVGRGEWRGPVLRDRLTDTTRTLVPEIADREEWSGAGVAVTPDLRTVVFASAAPDLVAGDSNGIPDVFVRPLLAPGGVSGYTLAAGEGETVQVGGTAAVPGLEVLGGEDPADPGVAGEGGDLRGVSVTVRPDVGDALLRLRLAHLPAQLITPYECARMGTDPSAVCVTSRQLVGHPRVSYTVTFDGDDGAQHRVWVGHGHREAVGADVPVPDALAGHVQADVRLPQGQPQMTLTSCPPSGPPPGGLCEEHALLGVAAIVRRHEIVVSLPLALLAGTSRLHDVHVAAVAGAVPGRPDITLGPATTVLDEFVIDGPVDIAPPEISIAVGPPGSDPPTEASFGSGVPVVDGSFVALASRADLPPGPAQLTARTCLAEHCEVAMFAVVLP